MVSHADILEDRESLSKPFLGSVAFHVGVALLFIAFQTYSGTRMILGTAKPGFGDSVSVNAVRSIHLPSRSGPLNPVANQTESLVPQKQAVKAISRPKPPEPKAIPLKGRPHLIKPFTPEETSPQRYRPQPLRENQVTTNQAPAAVSPMYAKPGTAAGVGVNPNSILGTEFGGYALLLMQRIAEHWNTGGLAGVRAPVAVITVRIFRNGSIQNPRITQSSGNGAVDNSALRAVIEAAPLPPLPPDYRGGYLDVDFQFTLQR
ncbi:MAG TPA: TonB family protein [Bryobacteraceae bacterium]|nr:TonB family protein [Bryobacteraceae bacterium]